MKWKIKKIFIENGKSGCEILTGEWKPFGVEPGENGSWIWVMEKAEE